jgi:glutaminyl-tRNA synthetase
MFPGVLPGTVSFFVKQASEVLMSSDLESGLKEPVYKDFIRDIIDEHNRSGRFGGQVCTRFPPEPNGFLHIGHAKAILLNWRLAKDYNGTFFLRFDDTNPVKEEEEYVRQIEQDVAWLGAKWDGEVKFASDYFQQMYDWAVQLIEQGDAYVDDQTPDEIRAGRGTLTQPGQESPFRDRPPAESLDLFKRMRAGEFPDGARVLRAKIDMRSPNVNLRDPIMYRILHARHHRTGDDWCLYPMYDWAHGLEDSIEGITHSICTLEFENHRPLYDWFLEKLGVHHPRQIEFARLNLNYTITSKRKSLQLVREGHVNGWDDPRMNTVAGLRRRGFTARAIQRFCLQIGVAKNDSVIDYGVLENAIRDDLNRVAPRRMAVLNPLKVVITNYPQGEVELMDAINNPEDEQAGTRQVPFSRELYLERDDFMEDPPRKFFRMAPGREVRLRYAYFVTCQEVIKDAAGQVVELHCTYDPATRGGDSPDGRKVKATLHWVSAQHAVDAEVRLYDRLFNHPNPAGKKELDFLSHLNPDSLKVLTGCKLEPTLGEAEIGYTCQFERLGYFSVDSDSDPAAGTLIFNRTVSLKDSWAKEQKKG